MAGVDVPVVPLRRQVAVTVPTEVVPAGAPMTIFPDGFHFRVRDGQLLLLQPSPPAADPFDVSVDPAWLAQVTASAHRAGARPARASASPRATPASTRCPRTSTRCSDRRPNLDNFFLVNGSSGHGVMHSPALGQLAAELLRGAPTALDVRPLRPGRFREGQPNSSQSLL